MRENRKVGEDVGWENQMLLYLIILIIFLPTQTHPYTFVHFNYEYDYNDGPQPQLAQPSTRSLQATDEVPVHDEYELEAKTFIADTEAKMV